MKKNEFVKPPGIEDTTTMDFIARNIVAPEWTPHDKKEVNLEKLMMHMGGTKGEIDRISQSKMIKRKK